jgi:hypothetical protein
MTCHCGEPYGHHDGSRVFFVSALDGPKSAFLAGPFETHDEALARVDEYRSRAYRDFRDVNPWVGFGTAQTDRETAKQIKVKYPEDRYKCLSCPTTVILPAGAAIGTNGVLCSRCARREAA